MTSILLSISRLLALPLLGLVRLYQLTLSPDHGWYQALHPYGFCRFAPSCSQYAYQGLQRDGLLALPRIALRLVRCHPWARGGTDPYVSLTQTH